MQHTEKELQAAREYKEESEHDSPFAEASWDDVLNAHLAGQRYAKENAWIRVDSGELPPKGERVWVYGEEIGIPSWAFWINENGEWTNTAGVKYGKDVITHYQLLPTLPAPPKD